jgi:hypothetical protein
MILSDLEFSETDETICELIVPPRLRSISLSFSAEIENISRGTQEMVAAGQTFEINTIDQSDNIQDLHLAPTAAGYILEVLGKTGEPRPKPSVRFTVRSRGIKDPVHVNLLTIRLANFNSTTRVHVLVDRYQPAFNAFISFSQIRDIERSVGHSRRYNPVTVD